MQEASFIGDLAWVVLGAGVAAVIFRLLRLPTLLGYLLAGLLIGPHLFEKALIHDEAIIHELSELGVVFLMFYIGLEFDVRKLKKVLGPAFAAIVRSISAKGIGLMFGKPVTTKYLQVQVSTPEGGHLKTVIEVKHCTENGIMIGGASTTELVCD